MKKKIMLLIIIILMASGCLKLDPYKNEINAASAIDSWFNYQNGETGLGTTRRKLEKIDEIVSKTCKYIENDNNNNYIFSCTITYKAISDTVIPLSKNEKINVYVALTFKDDRTFNYMIYKSGSEDKVWLKDELLNYGK